MKYITVISSFYFGAIKTTVTPNPLKNTNWPKYETLSWDPTDATTAGSTKPAANDANNYASLKNGLYGCIRDSLVAFFP